MGDYFVMQSTDYAPMPTFSIKVNLKRNERCDGCYLVSLHLYLGFIALSGYFSLAHLFMLEIITPL